jgi:2-keto-4-pentenoate hydratase/2-oxohepta-3-ene-1,7-dioic acid hydratase in catechol pathway
MKLITYTHHDNMLRLGVVVDNKVINLFEASNGELPNDMRRFLELGEVGMVAANDAVASYSAGVDIDSIKIKPPITDPSKIIAIGLNYMDHVRETGMAMPNIATMFCKYPSSLIGTYEEIRWNTQLTQKVDFEAELAIVIGKTARNVTEDDAFDYIAGYTNCNDVSARDLQLETGDQWLRGKCLDTFCPLGPWLVTRDEIPGPNSLAIKCLVNGELMQDSNTNQMIFRIPFLIKYLSEAFTLLPGDVVITGTPHGVGAFRERPVWLKYGDEIIIDIEGIGQLTNSCAKE